MIERVLGGAGPAQDVDEGKRDDRRRRHGPRSAGRHDKVGRRPFAPTRASLRRAVRGPPVPRPSGAPRRRRWRRPTARSVAPAAGRGVDGDRRPTATSDRHDRRPRHRVRPAPAQPPGRRRRRYRPRHCRPRARRRSGCRRRTRSRRCPRGGRGPRPSESVLAPIALRASFGGIAISSSSSASGPAFAPRPGGRTKQDLAATAGRIAEGADVVGHRARQDDRHLGSAQCRGGDDRGELAKTATLVGGRRTGRHRRGSRPRPVRAGGSSSPAGPSFRCSRRGRRASRDRDAVATSVASDRSEAATTASRRGG